MTSTEPRRAAPEPSPPFQFSLRTLLLLFVVLGSSLAVFGAWGAVVFVLVVGLAIYVHQVASFLSLVNLVLVVLCLMCLIGLLLPAVGSPRQAGRRSICENNLRQIALALQNYHQANGCFPPAYVADKNGKPMHSWRVLILPYVGFDDLYKAYDFTEPWDGPNNKKTESAAKRNLGTKGKSHVNEPVLRKSVVRCDLACRALRRFVLGPWGWRRPCRWQRPWRWWRPCRWWLSRRRRRDACRLL